MRDFAYEEVVLGNGVETMATPLVFGPGALVKGTPILTTKVLMSFDDFKGPYVPASALGPAIASSKRLLTQLSPHGHEEWIDCFSLEHLKALPLCKVQVEGAQMKTTHSSQDEVAAEDVARTKSAADHASRLFAKSQGGMSGEDFIETLHESPDIDLARQLLRRSNAGGAEVTSPSGSIMSTNDGDPVLELQCAECQSVMIKVGKEPPRGGYVIVHVVDPLEHAKFWDYFPEKSLALEIADDGDEECLLFSRFLKQPLRVQINVTVISPHGRMTREGIQASLSMTLNHRDMAQRVVERLASQYELKF